MKISLISIGRRAPSSAEERLSEEYLTRGAHYDAVEGSWTASATTFWALVDQTARRTPSRVILMDSGGGLQSSLEFAETMRQMRDQGTRQVFVGIGGPDGWDERSKHRADLVLSIGRWTLPHGLARIVVAEQIYRALTILAGHPYHCGH